LQSSTAVAASDVDMSLGSYFTKTLSANTTFTFSNPPASGTAGSFALEVTGADVTVGYDLANASFTTSLTGINGFSEGFTFNNDGTKLYITGISTDAVQQYTLSTAWDVSTATYDSVLFNVASQETSPKEIKFNNDGTSMYICGSDNDTIYQYTLTTAYDVSTASYASKSLSVGSQDTNPWSFTWNNDGTKLFLAGRNTGTVYEYNLSTAYDVSTGSYSSVSFSIASQLADPDGIEFNSDGTKMFISKVSSPTLFQYSLTTAYDVSTASFDNVFYNYSANASDSYGIAFSSDGTKFYAVNRGGNAIRQFSMGTSAPATITYPASVKWSGATTPDAPAAGEKDVYVFVTTDGGTTYYAKQAGDAVA
jgi:sugar lactone lactonase YvrE